MDPNKQSQSKVAELNSATLVNFRFVLYVAELLIFNYQIASQIHTFTKVTRDFHHTTDFPKNYWLSQS